MIYLVLFSVLLLIYCIYLNVKVNALTKNAVVVREALYSAAKATTELLAYTEVIGKETIENAQKISKKEAELDSLKLEMSESFLTIAKFLGGDVNTTANDLFEIKGKNDKTKLN